MLLHRYVVDTAGRLAVDIAVITEDVQAPVLSGDPGDNAGLYGSDVAYYEAVTR